VSEQQRLAGAVETACKAEGQRANSSAEADQNQQEIEELRSDSQLASSTPVSLG
jgi:hypothetical protein